MNSFGYVRALAVDGSGNVYAGGYFTTAGGVAGTNCIAKWNGSIWSALGTGMNTGGFVRALAVDGSGNVYAGGAFSSAGGVSANRIAKWRSANSTWSPLGTGLDSWAVALAQFQSDRNHVYAGGAFTVAGGKVSAYFGHFDNRMPVNTIAPTVTGTHRVYQTLTANPGTWSDPDGDTVTFSYQWERANDGAGNGAAPIPGATGSTYTVVPADSLKYLRVRVRADDGATGLASVAAAGAAAFSSAHAAGASHALTARIAAAAANRLHEVAFMCVAILSSQVHSIPGPRRPTGHRLSLLIDFFFFGVRS
jgi:hypothetical protein